MPKTTSNEVAIVASFDGIGEIETALGAVLSLQAKRVEQAMENPPGDEATPKQKADYQKEVDRNLNNLFKNGLALRNAKAASKTPTGPSVVLDADGKEIPKNATNEMIAWALDDMEAAGLDRRSLVRSDAIEHLRERGKILPLDPSDAEF